MWCLALIRRNFELLAGAAAGIAGLLRFFGGLRMVWLFSGGKGEKEGSGCCVLSAGEYGDGSERCLVVKNSEGKRFLGMFFVGLMELLW